MPIQPFGLCGPTYTTRSALWDQEFCVNWYPGVDEYGAAQSKVALLPCPGLQLFCTVPSASPPIQGLWTGDNRLYVVSGNQVWQINSVGTPIEGPGVLAGGGSTPVQFAASGGSLLIASGNIIYRVSAGLAIQKVLEPAISVVYIDNYYIALEDNTNTIRLHQMNSDGTIWPDIDYATLGPTDRYVRLEEHEGNLWIFGRKSILVWYNSGDPDFPWQRISGATINTGVIAPASIAKIDKRLYWLGRNDDGIGVFRTDGYTPVRISNQSIEYTIGEALKLSPNGADDLITGCGYTEDNHSFYSLTFPRSGGANRVYDITTNMWHERARWDPVGGNWQPWRGAGFHAYVFGKHIVARTGAAPFPDADIRNLYEQSSSFPADDGRAIFRYRTSPYVSDRQQTMFHHYLRLLTDTSANVTMRFRHDDNTWSNPITATPRNNEVHYRRLGRSRNRVYEVSILDATTRPALIEAFLHVEPAGYPPTQPGVPR